MGGHVDGRRSHGIHFHFRSARRSLRAAHRAASRHLRVRRLGVAGGAVGKLRDADRRAFAQRLRRRCCADHRAHVHRRDLSLRVARPHGVLQSVVHRVGTTGRLRQQPLRRESWWRRRVDVALDAGHRRGAGDTLLLRIVSGSGEPTLAGDARKAARGARRARPTHRQRTRGYGARSDAGIARARSAAPEARARGGPESGAARSAHHRPAGRHSAADHRHQLGAVVRRRDIRTRRCRRQCALHADRVRGPRQRRVHACLHSCSSTVSAAGPF